MGCGFIALDEDPAAPGAYRNTEGLFDKFEIPGETAVKEGKFLLGVKIYLCGNRSRSFLFLDQGKGIQAICVLQFERERRCLFLIFEFTGSHFKKNHTSGIRLFRY